MLTREQILQSDDLPRETVQVPEWGGEVQVRTMTGTDRDAFEASLIGKEGRLENVRARLVSLTLCDETGSRLFSDGDISALGGKSAKALDRVFAGLVAQGVGIWIGFQSFINMGVNLGALPTKGLTLPLMSYGGSAIMMNLVAIAIVLRIDAENKQLMRGGRS